MLRWTTTAVLAVLVLVASLPSPTEGAKDVAKPDKCRNGAQPDARGKCAQAVMPEKTEQAKSACTSDLCQNGGVCFERGGFARCNCTGTKFTGRTCEKNKAQVDREKAERQEVQGALAKMEQLKKDWKDKTDKCSAKDKRHVCPRDVGPKADQCVASMTDCWVDGLGKFNSTLMNQYRQKMKGIKDACNRTQGEKYCFKEETCVGRGLPCTPQQECPDDKPFRCGRSWKCQENKTMCDNDDATPPSCPADEQKCPGNAFVFSHS